MSDIGVPPAREENEQRIAKGLSRVAQAAVVIGNWLEFYDFIVYSYFAVMIGDAFFPGHSNIVRLLGSLAAFGVGFLTRPLGAAIIGAYADRAGRRAALTLSILLMAVGTGLVGVTPTYAQIGVAAPLILVAARLIQGFSCGGEMGPATTYLLESAPVRRRAALTAWQAYSQGCSMICGSLVGFILSGTLSRTELYSWGWRIPFLLGILIAPVGAFVRRRLPETLEGHGRHATGRAVLVDLARHHWRPLLLGILIISGLTVSTYIFIYMTTYAITTLKLSATFGTALTLTGSLALFPGLAIGVWADKFGRKRVLVGARLVLIALVYPVFQLITSPGTSPAMIIALNMLLNFEAAIGIGAVYAFLPEAFPRRVRSSGLSILYAASVTVFGGTTQFVVAWLIHLTGDPLVPAWYQITANLMSIVGIILLVPHAEVKREYAAATQMAQGEYAPAR